MNGPFIPQDITAEKIASIQLSGLKWTVAHAYANSPFYRRRLDFAGVAPDDIQSLDDLRRLPFLTAQDLQDGYPFPLRSVPFEEIVRIHASSGTTGKRKVLAYTRNDLDTWQVMFARCCEMAGLSATDRVQIAVGYGLWTAGAGFQLGVERFGALAIPVGPANTEMHAELLVDMQSTVFCATASMALLMAEEIERRGIRDRIALKKIIFGAERHSRRQRERISALTGARELYDIPGLTELYGPGSGLECSAHQGLHYWADIYILEVLNPETLEPVAEGEVGEMVVTSLRKEAAPLIRYRTRDLTRLIPGPCPCGCTLPRHDHLLGRSDDMFIFRAVNIYPGQIDHVLSQLPDLGSEYQVHLFHREDGRDVMLVKVERARDAHPASDAAAAQAVADAIRKHILVRAQVELVDYGSLPRTERKSRRVFDRRLEENGSARS